MGRQKGTGGGDLGFELGTPGFFLRPDYFELLARLREESPVHPTADGMVALSRYEDVRTVSRDPVRFVSGRGVLVNDPLRRSDDAELRAFSILHLDPPAHATYRSLVNREFTPRVVTRFAGRVRQVVRDALDAAPVDRPVDFVGTLAAPVPIAVIAELLGVGATDRDRFRRWSDAAIESPDHQDEEQAGLLAELSAFLLAHVDSPAVAGHALLDLLKSVPIGDRLLDRSELLGFCITLLVAGNETTRTLLAGGAEALARCPDQRRLLVEDPDRIAAGVEELLRWVTPIQAFGRTAAVDTALAGHPVPAGTFVVMLYASANRDESVFGTDAGTLDVLRRTRSAHLAFGFGEHVCIGAALARLEARIFFEELLERHPHFELAGEPEYTASTLMRGARSMPVVLEP